MIKIALTLSFVFGALLVSARPAPEKRPSPLARTGEERHSRHIWRAFGELSDAERKEMLQLQRENPEKFLEVMKKKAEAFFKAEKAERQLIADLAQKYRSEKNKSRKEKIKQELSELLKKRFNKRLSINRKHVENMKKRTRILEQELDKRAANSEKIIQVQLSAVLEGKELRPPRRPYRGVKPRPGQTPAKQKTMQP